MEGRFLVVDGEGSVDVGSRPGFEQGLEDDCAPACSCAVQLLLPFLFFSEGGREGGGEMME